MSVATAQEPFISGNEAKHALGWGWNRLYRAVIDGDIRTKQIPGQRDVRYYREDVQRVAREIGRQPAGA